MDNCKLELGKINGNAFVLVERKPIKNVHLKVYRDLSIKLSVPQNVPDEWIEKFLNKKKSWINEQLFKYKQSSGSNNLSYLRNGCSIQMLGKDKRVYLQEGRKNIQEDEKRLLISLDNKTDYATATKYFCEWWRKSSYDLYLNEVTKFYNKIFKKYGVSFPQIQIRKMKTMWGNCNPVKSLITLNEYLYKANLLGIQYVVLHEMTHLLYPKHNNNFYSFLTVHMPDWKERKKILDVEVVQGI